MNIHNVMVVDRSQRQLMLYGCMESQGGLELISFQAGDNIFKIELVSTRFVAVNKILIPELSYIQIVEIDIK